MLGQAVTNHNQVIAITSMNDDDLGPNTGAVSMYDFKRYGADLNNDFSVDFLDISLFVQAFQIQDPLADLVLDGEFDFADISEFLSLYSFNCQ